MYPTKKIALYGEIVLISFFALFLHVLIMMQTCSNCAFFTLFICLFGWIPAIIIGLVIILFILKTKYERYVTLKNSTIFSFFLALIIIIHAISFYCVTVPPNEVTNQWHYDKGQEISEVMKWMGIHYSTTFADRSGYFYQVTNATQGTGYDWDYDIYTKVITMTEGYNQEWELQLRLDIDFVGSYYTMTTYYVDDVNFNLFDPLLFDNTTWKGSMLWEDQ